MDDGIVERDAGGRLERLVEELLVGEGVCAVLRVDGEQAPHEGDAERGRARARGLAEQARGPRDVANDEGGEVEAQQRVVEVEEHGSYHGGLPGRIRGRCVASGASDVPADFL